MDTSVEETRPAKKNRADLWFLVLCAAFLLLFGSWIFIKQASSFSEEENRSLQTFPQWRVETWLDGSFTKEMNLFYSDQFPLRSLFLKIHATTEIGAGRQENNQVLLGKNGTLITRLEYSSEDYSHVLSNLEYLEALQKALQGENIPMTLAITPRAIDIEQEALPATYSYTRASQIWNLLDSGAVDYVSFTESLQKAYREGGNVWFRTDHHWTVEGAYLAYCRLSSSLGYTPREHDAFEYRVLSDSFFGTAYSKSGLYFVSPDELGVMRYPDDTSFRVEIRQGAAVKTIDGFYAEEFLATKDKYAVFLSGNYAEMHITKEPEEVRPTLLLVKDSFANALIPFLAIHYDLVVVDPRYSVQSTYRLALEESVDRVLVLYNADSLVTDSLQSLLLGLPKS